MKRALLVTGACAVATAICIGAAGAIGATGDIGASGRQLPPGAPALRDPTVPSMPRDVGAGELLHLVVGGTYDTREQAEAAGASMSFGDLQGYYVVPVAQFGGLQARLPVSGRWALVSAFRTLDGAKDFAELARAAGAPALVTERLSSRGGEYAGLGQEPAPDGQGPLTHPIPASMPRDRRTDGGGPRGRGSLSCSRWPWPPAGVPVNREVGGAEAPARRASLHRGVVRTAARHARCSTRLRPGFCPRRVTAYRS